MTSIKTDEFLAIHPTIAEFDDINDTLAYIADEELGAPSFLHERFEKDKEEYLILGKKLYSARNEGSRLLRDFMKLCGKIALSEEVEQSKYYPSALDLIIVDNSDDNITDEDAKYQASIVVQRFTHSPNIKAFDVLYGSRKSTKKTTPKTPKKQKPLKINTELKSPEIPDVTTPIIERSLRPVVISTRLARERSTRKSETDRGSEMTDDIFIIVNNFIEQHGGVVKANRVYRHIEELLGPEVDRESVRNTIRNLLEAEQIHNAGASKGMLLLAIDPELKIDPKPENEINDDLERQNQDYVEIEDLSKHELAPKILHAIFSQRHQNRGCTVKEIALSYGVDEEEVRRVAKYFVDNGSLAREKRWVRSRSPHSTKKQSLFLKFPSQEAWDAYKLDKSRHNTTKY